MSDRRKDWRMNALLVARLSGEEQGEKGIIEDIGGGGARIITDTFYNPKEVIGFILPEYNNAVLLKALVLDSTATSVRGEYRTRLQLLEESRPLMDKVLEFLIREKTFLTRNRRMALAI